MRRSQASAPRNSLLHPAAGQVMWSGRAQRCFSAVFCMARRRSSQSVIVGFSDEPPSGAAAAPARGLLFFFCCCLEAFLTAGGMCMRRMCCVKRSLRLKMAPLGRAGAPAVVAAAPEVAAVAALPTLADEVDEGRPRPRGAAADGTYSCFAHASSVQSQ